MEDGILLYNQGSYEQALDFFLSAEVGSEDYPLLAYYLGLTYTQLERFDEAMLYLEQVVTSPESGIVQVYQARMILAYIYSITERFDLAVYELSELERGGSESVQLYALLGYAYFHEGKVDESIEVLNRALELEPANPNALNSLGYILAVTGKDKVSGLAYCRRAVDIDPENPAYLDSLGWAYFKNRRFSEAASYLKAAAAKSPDSKVIASHLRQLEDLSGK
ncbi:MAG: tetratricopeptide repeat protein [Spirochaetales bacterium]|nr:tetratricopeptide repeat protein [Spirochaetales bacterium]MCF7937048.1 tetratricopeptide repeat protein [Spirochaetales bacterium]